MRNSLRDWQKYIEGFNRSIEGLKRSIEGFNKYIEEIIQNLLRFIEADKKTQFESQMKTYW